MYKNLNILKYTKLCKLFIKLIYLILKKYYNINCCFLVPVKGKKRFSMLI
jgi:hypothetical protein